MKTERSSKKAERAVRLARLPKGTMWKSEHPECRPAVESQKKSISSELSELIREKQNAFVPVRNSRQAWVRKYRNL